jgi:hypothetical protein
LQPSELGAFLNALVEIFPFTGPHAASISTPLAVISRHVEAACKEDTKRALDLFHIWLAGKDRAGYVAAVKMADKATGLPFPVESFVERTFPGMIDFVKDCWGAVRIGSIMRDGNSK